MSTQEPWDFAQAVAKVVETLRLTDTKSAVAYLSPNLVVKATRRDKGKWNWKHCETLLTIGRPNVREKKVIRSAEKEGATFPLRSVRMRGKA